MNALFLGMLSSFLAIKHVFCICAGVGVHTSSHTRSRFHVVASPLAV